MKKETVYLITVYYNSDYGTDTYCELYKTKEARDIAYNEKVEELKSDIKADWGDDIDLTNPETYEDDFSFNEDTNFTYYEDYTDVNITCIRKEEQGFKDSGAEETVIWNFTKED